MHEIARYATVAAMERINFYASSALDRAAQRRTDEAWLTSLRRARTTRVLPVWRSKNLVVPGESPLAVMLEVTDAEMLFEACPDCIFIGLVGDVAHFVVDLSHIDDPSALPPLAGRGEFVDLRAVGANLPRGDGALLAYARGITHWHRTHRFCGVCGSPSEMRDGGHVRVCTNPDCKTSHFPRTDPAVIMLVSQGDRCLLGRKAEWPEGMYSTLAGFVEPGESLEDAVAREVMEETGVSVTDVRYHSSQPWPFPASLMLGFFATATSEEIRYDNTELDDARWFTRLELSEGAAGLARRPRSDSIARRLLETWIAEG
ncbi:MAG: NAD(+) diphosphatase [Rhodospirillales bacterium]